MQLLINALIAGSLAALLASGLSLVYGILRVFNLALGQTVLIGGYVAWWLFDGMHLPMLVTILGGIGAGALVSWLTYDVFVKPFYRRHPHLTLVTTIALGMMLDALILLVFEERPRSIQLTWGRTLEFGGMIIGVPQLFLVITTLVLLCLFAFLLHSTAFGRRIRAVAQQDTAAMSLGVDAPSLHRLILIMSGVLAACGGIFIAIDQNLSPTLAFPLTIKAYAAVTAGGMGNVWGTILCAYLIALLEQLVVGVHWFGAFYVPAGFQATVPLLFIIIFLLFKPTGLFLRASRAA
ncbi:branched-chain amino acid ABC transporter permease [Candidatus Peregrinibacteria bacterium]|nr:branched-chain amino acid ABC transporter permease [Candidatus Peregrinibacteria bacterium]MBI3816356.1 branched-chain amino acid ABC transporter permease [Candidatus Peregrinibacteria bacterium]